jgi:hypothetical protein
MGEGGANMFEKRLQAFAYAAGIAFIMLAAVTVLTYIWFLLQAGGTFDNIFIFYAVPVEEIANYLLNLKLLAVIVGTIFVICYFWRKKLAGPG